MKHRKTLFTATRLSLCFLALGCFGFPQRNQAVTPPPDGGYPSGNTAEGDDALFGLTSGSFNTAIGSAALFSNSSGYQNTATGVQALFSNTTGYDNTANGDYALNYNTTGLYNTANGAFALLRNTTGSYNTANGDYALKNNTTGRYNTANGVQTLFHNTNGQENTAIGYLALYFANGGGNTAVGMEALYHNTNGSFNTANGDSALEKNTTGGYNTATGVSALQNNTAGSDNIGLGAFAGFNVTTANNIICIGAGVNGANVSNSCYIGNIFGSTSSNGAAVFVNSNGRLGTMTSSARFKDEIKPMNNASEALFAMKPVSFRYKKDIDSAGTPQLGLVAEDVEKVNPDLVVRDKEGKPYGVRYDQVNAMLLNEFLKEHRKVEAQARTMDAQEHKIGEQEATISELKRDLQTVVARLKDQESQIQRVSAEVEMNKRSPHVVATNP